MDDPARLKRCKGCGQEKPVTEFRDNGDGYPTARCKVCHRAQAKLDMAARYRAQSTDPVFREARRQERRAHYWRYRPLDQGEFVRVCPCHGKVCRLWVVDDTVRCAVNSRRLRKVRVEARRITDAWKGK